MYIFVPLDFFWTEMSAVAQQHQPTRIWMVQGNEPNEWMFAEAWQARMCEKAASGKHNYDGVYTSNHPAWAARHGRHAFVCTRDGSHSLEDPPGQLYILNMTTGKRRYVQALPGHQGAEDTGSFAMDVGGGMDPRSLPDA